MKAFSVMAATIAATAQLVGAGATAGSSTDAADQCEARLARSLAVMQERPLLKEEHATALMWLRLDARDALNAGDASLCLRTMETVETLLQMDDDDTASR